MYPDSEILFPPRCIQNLENLRGKDWLELVRRVDRRPEDHVEKLGFSLMMIKLGGCLTCDLDSYRASLGCATCSKRTVSGFKGTDKALIKKFDEACKEVGAYLGLNGSKRSTRASRKTIA
jgi:hypothetical protein